MEEKGKEILDPRKVFPLFLLFLEKVEWRLETVKKEIQKSVGVFTLMTFW